MGYYTTYSLEIEDPDETLTLEDVLLFMAPTAKPLRIWVGTQVGRIIIRPVKDGTGLGRKYALHLKEFDNVDCRSNRHYARRLAGVGQTHQRQLGVQL